MANRGLTQDVRPTGHLAAGPSARELWPRIVNALLGAWLCASASIWHQSAVSTTHTWFVGLVVMAVALGSVWVPSLRWANGLLGAWLLLSSAPIFHLQGVSLLNHALVGTAVLLVSLIHGTSLATPRQQPLRG